MVRRLADKRATGKRLEQLPGGRTVATAGGGQRLVACPSAP